MRKFILKLLLFVVPLVLPVLLYVWIDPFKVIWNYEEPINTSKSYQWPINRDHQTTELFLKNYKNYKYDSFILGNSRSFFFQVDTWKRYIQGNCFHFNAYSEGIFGIERKLKFLDRSNVKIKNVLLVLDVSTLRRIKNNEGHLYIKHPATSGESYFSFHSEMFKGFFPKAMFAFTDLYFSDRSKDYMKTYGVTEDLWKHDKVSNQLTYYIYDEELSKDPETYYKKRKNSFPLRNPVEGVSKLTIQESQLELLNNIHDILKKHGTNYKVLINPDHDQMKLNPKDLEKLKQIFGEKNVYDFSGKNRITTNNKNYYEAAHFRPFIGDSLLSIIYK